MMQLDLKSERGHAVFMRLVERADVLVENMRAPVKDRLKIGWEDVKKINPRLVASPLNSPTNRGARAERAA